MPSRRPPPTGGHRQTSHHEEPPPQLRRSVHGKNNPVKATPHVRTPANDEVVLNALAFSTLLSSQETGAHHPPAHAAHPGQPLNFTLRVPACQLGVSGLFPTLHQLLRNFPKRT